MDLNRLPIWREDCLVGRVTNGPAGTAEHNQARLSSKRVDANADLWSCRATILLQGRMCAFAEPAEGQSRP